MTTFVLEPDYYDHLVNAAALQRVEWSEEIRTHNGVNYVKVVGTLNGEHYDTHYECNLTRRATEAEIIDFINVVFAYN